MRGLLASLIVVALGCAPLASEAAELRASSKVGRLQLLSGFTPATRSSADPCMTHPNQKHDDTQSAKPRKINPENLIVRLRSVISVSDYREQTGISVVASASDIAFGEASASMSAGMARALRNDTISFLATISYQEPPEVLPPSATTFVLLNSIPDDARPDKANTEEERSKRMSSLENMCGTHYVSEVQRENRITVQIDYSGVQRELKKKFASALNAKYDWTSGEATVDAKFASAVSELERTSSRSVSLIVGSGGDKALSTISMTDPGKLVKTLQEALGHILSSGQRAAPNRYLLRSYRSLFGFEDTVLPPPDEDLISAYYAARARLSELEDIRANATDIYCIRTASEKGGLDRQIELAREASSLARDALRACMGSALARQTHDASAGTCAFPDSLLRSFEALRQYQPEPAALAWGIEVRTVGSTTRGASSLEFSFNTAQPLAGSEVSIGLHEPRLADPLAFGEIGGTTVSFRVDPAGLSRRGRVTGQINLDQGHWRDQWKWGFTQKIHSAGCRTVPNTDKADGCAEDGDFLRRGEGDLQERMALYRRWRTWIAGKLRDREWKVVVLPVGDYAGWSSPSFVPAVDGRSATPQCPSPPP